MNTDETTDELMQRVYRAQVEEAHAQLAANAALIDDFTNFARARGLSLRPDSISYIPTIGIVAYAPGLTNSLLGSISRERDELLSYSRLSEMFSTDTSQSGYFTASNFMLMVHPYFRRQMHECANFAPRFVDLFWAFERPEIQKFIAIDEDRVRINVDETMYFEADTWYGAPFNEEVARIPNGNSKLRPPSDLEETYISFLFASTYCLDVKWSQDGDIKTFQALEMKTPNVQIMIGTERYHPSRYIHAEFDMSMNVFRHFDGAVQLYNESEYLLRRDSDFNYNVKHQNQIKARSKKLFKFNGALTTTDWVDFCCHFFTGNPLTFEYFTGAYPEHVIDIIARLRERRSKCIDAKNELGS